jgi:hypothetical protein
MILLYGVARSQVFTDPGDIRISIETGLETGLLNGETRTT